MGKVCVVDVPVEKTGNPWIVYGAIMTVTFLVSLALIIYIGINKPVLEVTVAPSKLDLRYKCRLCGAENHIEESIVAYP